MSTLHGSMRALFRAPHDSPGIVRARDLPRCAASGPVPQRILAVGGELLSGFGVSSHELGLGGALAREVGAATGFGVDVDLEIGRSTSLDSLARLLAGLTLDDVDALVLVLDAEDLVRKLPELEERLRRLVFALALRLHPFSRITVAVGGPLPHLLTGRSPRCGEAAVREVGEAVKAAVLAVPRTEAVILPTLSAVSPEDTTGAYQEWGALLARSLAGGAEPSTAHRARYERLDEVARQDAVDRLGTLDAAWEAGFGRIVEFARIAYGTRYAAISVVDGPVTRFMQRRGFDLESAARQETICDTALRYRGGLVVGDASTDSRFRDAHAVQAGMSAFYVGHRVRSPEGQAIAALCVFDPEPREVDGSETVALRDFALAAERRIWELLHRHPARTGSLARIR